MRAHLKHHTACAHLWKFNPAQPRPTLSNLRYLCVAIGSRFSENVLTIRRILVFFSSTLHRFYHRFLLMLQQVFAATQARLSLLRSYVNEQTRSPVTLQTTPAHVSFNLYSSLLWSFDCSQGFLLFEITRDGVTTIL